MMDLKCTIQYKEKRKRAEQDTPAGGKLRVPKVCVFSHSTDDGLILAGHIEPILQVSQQSVAYTTESD